MRQSILAFAARRLVATLPVLAGAVVFVFVVMRLLPADPAAFLVSGPQGGAEQIAALRARLGLDRSIPEQLAIYVRDVAGGDLGRSTTTGEPVLADLMARLPASLELTVTAFLLALVAGIALGTAAAFRPGSMIDHGCRLIGTAGASLPGFVVGLCLIYVFYVRLGWSPEPVGRLDGLLDPPSALTGFLLIDSAMAGDWTAWRSAAGHLVLPAATMALFALAPLARITRAAMIEVLASDYVRTARALDLPAGLVIVQYGLRNAAVPIVTTLGLIFSYMLGANVLVEKVFAWPGIGSYALDAVLSADYAPIQGFVLLVAASFAVVNLGVDILYGLLDPRARIRP